MKLQMKTAKERKRKEPLNKHKAKNMKTNSLQTKSSREQFHLTDVLQPWLTKIRSLIELQQLAFPKSNSLFHSQRNFRPVNLCYIWKDEQNQGRINEELLLKHHWEGEVKAGRNFKQKASHRLLAGSCSRKRETDHKNWRSLICSIILWQPQYC